MSVGSASACRRRMRSRDVTDRRIHLLVRFRAPERHYSIFSNDRLSNVERSYSGKALRLKPSSDIDLLLRVFEHRRLTAPPSQ